MINPNPGTYSVTELEDLPTLAQGHAEDLKLDDGQYRVWLCRCGVEDGMPYDNAVTVEELCEGRWVQHCMYKG